MSAISLSYQKGKKPPISKGTLTRVKGVVLGARYALSVAFVDAPEMRRLNKVYRGKDTPTDILAFPLSQTSGEIIFCPEEVTRHARACKRTDRNYLLFLVIHGLLHLKGMTHGRKMEREERKFQKRFGI